MIENNVQIYFKLINILLLVIILNIFTCKQICSNDYYLSSEDPVKNISIDEFIKGNITSNEINYYSLNIANDTEEILIDYQSKYGCILIYIGEQKPSIYSSHFIFCSSGINSIYSINKSDILEKYAEEGRTTIQDLTMTLAISYSFSEKGLINNFLYSMKISLKKPIINIYYINSEHKYLCNNEIIQVNLYRCLFIIEVNENKVNDKLVIYPKSQKNIYKMNIYADYIDKEKYIQWDTDYLINNIPNNESNYTNINKEKDMLIIPNIEANKYIYLSIETTNITAIELFASFVSNNLIKTPLMNEIQINCITNNYSSINFDLSKFNDITISIITLSGKASFYFQNDKSIKYITDERESNLFFDINKNNICLNDDENCTLIINNLGNLYQNKSEYIFYISYKEKSLYSFNEIAYDKSNKFSYINQDFPLIYYSKISEINSSINININFYNISLFEQMNISDNSLIFEVMIVSSSDIQKMKRNPFYIKKNDNNAIKGYFSSSLLSGNIYLSNEEMLSFNITEDPWLLIFINKNDDIDFNFNNITEEDNKIIVEITISEINSLIYPAERIYHYGKLDLNKNRNVYRLKAFPKYHLMRIEFSCNSKFIEWSVKRKNDNETYFYNDTDLSMVTEKWGNGRELITIYIENGEDIYLTIFVKEEISLTLTAISQSLTNYAFKYINSEKNGDFKNYFIKNDKIYFDSKNRLISVNKITGILPSSIVKYNLKMIGKNFMLNEALNTIALSESKGGLYKPVVEMTDKIYFSLKGFEIGQSIPYYFNVLIQIYDDSEVENVVYSGVKIIFYDDNDNYYEDDFSIWFIIIGSVLAIIIIWLLCSICKAINKYKYYSRRLARSREREMERNRNRRRSGRYGLENPLILDY